MVVAGIETRGIGIKEEALVGVVEIVAGVGTTPKYAGGATMLSMRESTTPPTTRYPMAKELLVGMDVVDVADVSTIQAGAATGAKIRVRNGHQVDSIVFVFAHIFLSTFDRTKDDWTR